MKTDDENYKATKKKFKNALDRLINKRVVNAELRKRLAAKGTIKINRRTLELESGMSSGSLRHYPEIVEMINALNRNTTNIGIPTKDLEARLAKVTKDRTDVKNTLKQTKLELTRYKRLCQSQSAQYHMVLEVMMSSLTAEQKEKLFISLEEHEYQSSNIVDLFSTPHPKE